MKTLNELRAQIEVDLECAIQRERKARLDLEELPVDDMSATYALAVIAEAQQQQKTLTLKLHKIRRMEAEEIKVSGIDHPVPLSYSNAENEAIKHELVEWLEKTKAARLEAERVGKWEADIMNYDHSRPLSAQQPFVASPDRWQFCADQFIKAEPGSDESNKWYNEMLSNVSLGTDYPCITSQSETTQISNESRSTQPLTLAEVWYKSRFWVGWLLVIAVGFYIQMLLVSHL